MRSFVLVEVDCLWSQQRCQDSLGPLPPEVQARALRYRCDRARRSLLASQTALRQILDFLDVDQRQLAVCPKGRPYLKDSDLEFNLSHSQDRAVIGLARDNRLREGFGVDVEWMNRSVERDALAERFFSTNEFHYTRESPQRFFRIWTRKEAVLKSNGVGLRVPLNSFQVLEDVVSQEITGRALRLGTESRADDYVVSWALPVDRGEFRPVWVEAEAPGWLAKVAEGIAG
jgi:phosphopantetheine--protein transferase-like protein